MTPPPFKVYNPIYLVHSHCKCIIISDLKNTLSPKLLIWWLIKKKRPGNKFFKPPAIHWPSVLGLSELCNESRKHSNMYTLVLKINSQ